MRGSRIGACDGWLAWRGTGHGACAAMGGTPSWDASVSAPVQRIADAAPRGVRDEVVLHPAPFPVSAANGRSPK
jgi:hypothetical protein